MAVGFSETPHYRWDVQSPSAVLGQGGFGCVYLGTDKRNGDKVAVKVFRKSSDFRANIKKETDVQKSLTHPHITELLAIEREQVSGSQVIILEYCNGGNLHHLIQTPDYSLGLDDQEFLLVLTHLSEALAYLHKHHIIHRDVKPDNIMRHVFDNGHTVYKIADFGAARHLAEGEYFDSLHGTAAYLHPYLHEYNLDRGNKSSYKFDSKMDLWSIGVTLFHIATGELPFQVKNHDVKRTIFAAMKEQDGIISTKFVPSSKKVHYNKTLPAQALMSQGLKVLITPLIAKLFCLKPEQVWAFPDFHTHVKEIINKQIIKVFYVNKMKFLRIFINSADTFATFQDHITDQTKIPKDHQIFFYKRDFRSTFQVLPKTDFEGDYVFLLDTAINQIIPSSCLSVDYSALNKFKENFMLGNNRASNADTDLILELLNYLHLYLSIMRQRSDVYKVFDLFMEDFSLMIENRHGRNEVKARTDCIKRYSSFMDGPPSAEVAFFERKLNTMTEKINLIPIDFVKKDATLHASYYKALFHEIDSIKPLYQAISPKPLLLEESQYDFEKVKFLKCFNNIVVLLKKMDPIFEYFVQNKKSWYLNTFLPYMKTDAVQSEMLYKDTIVSQKYETDLIFNVSLRAEQICQNYDETLNALSSYRKNTLDTHKLLEENKAIMAKLVQCIGEENPFLQ